MGVWGAALYSGDFAMDLRATVSAVARLPFEPDRLLDILADTEPAALDSGNDDHTTFWLVVADQFARRGIVCDRAKAKAIAIIDAAEDLAALEALGMAAGDLRKRRKQLQELRGRILAAAVEKPRVVLKKPQPLLMERGDVVVYPTCRGRCINPYYSSKELDIRHTKDGPQPWRHDGWAACVVVDCGRAFEFLAWYRPLTMAYAVIEKPALESLRGQVQWRLESAGTCSTRHWQRMELERVGRFSLDPDKLRALFPQLRPGISAAVHDISLANRLGAAPPVGELPPPKSGVSARGAARTMAGIEQILR